MNCSELDRWIVETIPIILSESLQARANRVVFEYISIVLLKACCAPSVILWGEYSRGQCSTVLANMQAAAAMRPRTEPVCFIKNDDFMPAHRQCDFLLSKHLYPVPYNINTSECSIGTYMSNMG